MPTPGERLRLLGALLAAPAAESRGLLEDFSTRHGWLAAPLEELAAIPLDEWQAEHTRLFVNGHPRTICPPFQSAWLDGMMPGPATAAVAALYRRLGLEEDGISPDFLGTMLECAAHLEELSAEPVQAEQVQAVKHALWLEHLGRWLPQFAQALHEGSRLALYRGLARQLSGLCGENCA